MEDKYKDMDSDRFIGSNAFYEVVNFYAYLQEKVDLSGRDTNISDVVWSFVSIYGEEGEKLAEHAAYLIVDKYKLKGFRKDLFYKALNDLAYEDEVFKKASFDNKKEIMERIAYRISLYKE